MTHQCRGSPRAASGFSRRTRYAACMKRRILATLAAMIAAECVAADEPKVNTFSIVARDAKTGELGVAVQSRYFGVGTVVPWAKAGVGAVAAQADAKVSYGPDGLKLMEQGKSAREALMEVTEADKKRDIRQVGMVDAKGGVAAFTGAECMEWAGHREGEDFCVQGNLFAGEAVVDAMKQA